MELNNIQLPATVIASLYKSVLVETTSEDNIKTPTPAVPEPEATLESEWKYLGLNQKNILVVVNHQDSVHLPDHDLDFLTGVLSACKLHVGDVAIINFNNYGGKNYKEILKHFSSRIVLFFDLSPEQFGLPVVFPQFQVQQHGGLSFLYGPPIGELEKDKILKSKLWVSLRRLFNV